MELKQDSSKLKLYYQSYTVKFQFTLQSVESSCSTQYETHGAIKICLEICWYRDTCQARFIMKLRTTTKYINEQKKNIILT